MNSKQPLNDTWLFWNAERIEEFPHASENDYTCATADGDDEKSEQGPSPAAMMEDLLLYVGGVSAALVGMGLVILIGSFVSAYSDLNGADASDRVVVLAQPYLSLQRSARSGKSAPPEAIVLEPARSRTASGVSGTQFAARDLAASRRVSKGFEGE
jgi:hypothetical protein